MSWRVMPSRAIRTVGQAELRRYKVLYIIDGDGFAVSDGPHAQPREIIRMLCMDAPERDQPGWKDARDALADLIEGKSVRLEPEHKWRYVRDLYGRCLCYVFLNDLLVNAEMVRLGWSCYLTKFGRGRYRAIFLRCTDDAQAERRGIWRLFEPGDTWTWGRGRAKKHFHTAEEMQAYKQSLTTLRNPSHGKILTNPWTTPGIDRSKHFLAEQGWPVLEAKSLSDKPELDQATGNESSSRGSKC